MPIVPYKSLRPRVDPTVWVAPTASLAGDVRVAAEASIWFGAVLRGDLRHVAVGSRSNIQDGAVLHVTREWPCEVGDEVTVGHNATVHGCIVEDGCLVGMGAVILTGARVGQGSLVAAGAVVREDAVIPPRSLVVGVPGRVLRTLDDDAGREAALRYVEEARVYRLAEEGA